MKVRVVMMQRDEGDALVRWVGHYAGLFGFENLAIMDNGSVDRFTLNVLREVEAKGGRIFWGLDSQNDFQNKGGHIQNIIGHWDAEYDYDFALPVDCDEILAVFTDDGLVTDHAAIMAEFERLLPFRCALRIDMSMFNVPERFGWFSPDRDFHKGFLPARSLAAMDNGHHAPESRLAPGFETTRLTYLHWHNRSHSAVVRMARKKLEDLVDVDDLSALLAFERTPKAPFERTPKAPGAHLVRTLLMSEQEYLTRYADNIAVSVPLSGGQVNLVDDGVTLRVWDPERYLAVNPDVRAYSLTPLHHYLRYGFLEGRGV